MIQSPTNQFLDEINTHFEHSFSLCAEIAKEMGCTSESLLAAKRVFSYNPNSRKMLDLFPEFAPIIEQISNLVDLHGQNLQTNASNPEVWTSLGYCYLTLGDFPNAFAAFAHALRISPNSEDLVFWYAVGVVYAHYGYKDHARSCLEKVLHFDPQFEFARDVTFRLAVLCRQLGDSEHALRHFENVLANPPNGLTREDIQLQIGYTYQLADSTEKALSIYRDLYQNFPDSLQVIVQYAWFVFLGARSDEDFAFVQKMVEHGLRVHPKAPNLLLIAARIAMKQGNIEAAYNHFRFCIDYCNDNPYFWCGLGVVYYRNEQINDAVVAFQRALYLQSGIVEAWLNIGLIFEQMEDIPHAEKVYDTAQGNCPNCPEIQARIMSIRQQHQHQGLGQKSLPAFMELDDKKLITAPAEVFANDYVSAVPELPSRCFGENADGFRLLATYPQSYFK